MSKNIDKINTYLEKIYELEKNIDKYENLIYKYKNKVKEIKNILLEICPHNDITEERSFDYQSLQYYRYCNICNSYIDYERFLKLRNYKITKK